jgi:hypothetical protein
VKVVEVEGLGHDQGAVEDRVLLIGEERAQLAVLEDRARLGALEHGGLAGQPARADADLVELDLVTARAENRGQVARAPGLLGQVPAVPALARGQVELDRAGLAFELRVPMFIGQQPGN